MQHQMPDSPVKTDSGRPYRCYVAMALAAAAAVLGIHAAVSPAGSGLLSPVLLQTTSMVLFLAALFWMDRRRRMTLSDLTVRASQVNDRLRNIVAVSPAGFYKLGRSDLQSNGFSVDYIGASLRDIFGFDEHDWRSSPSFWFEHLHPDDRAHVMTAQTRLLRDGAVSHEYRFRCADGSYRWINDQLRLIHGADGTTIEIMGAWLDITDRKQAELTQRESEQRYRTMFECNPGPMWVYDVETLRFLAVNEAAVARYGYSQEEFLQMTIRDIRPPADVPRLLETVAKIDANGDRHQSIGVWTHIDRTGREFKVEINGHPMVFDGRRAKLVLVHDITDRLRAEENLRLIGHVFESSQEGMFITDANTRFIAVNKAFTRITGYTLEDVIGRTPKLMHSGRQDAAFYRALWAKIVATGGWQGELWNRRSNGDLYPLWLSISAIRDEQGTLQQYLCIFTETSKRRAADERIEFLANHDAMTGLVNRTRFVELGRMALLAAQRLERPVSLMYIDLDDFQQVNEVHGHETGDAVLTMMAARIGSVLMGDDVACRQGADEFILLLPDHDAVAAARVADTMLTLARAPFEVDGHSIALSASIGVAMYPDNGADVETLLRTASRALQQAKEDGRNSFRFFTRDMQSQAHWQRSMERDLRRALDEEALALHYQPQVDLTTGEVVGLEALARWSHPERGWVSPAEFIPVAEQSGMIRELGAWVIRSTTRQIADWRAQGLATVPVAVNLSMQQFRQPGLSEFIRGLLADTGLPGGALELELTEGVAMMDSDFTVSTIDGLKQLGLTLSIDDFGTGYSSLSYLKRFNVDKLKIDKSFVDGIESDPEDVAIVRTVIQLARELGIRTIAEGVETEAQRQKLRELSCDEMQGWLISPAVAPGEVARRYLAPAEPRQAAIVG
jgi:diguanylate cyclase (GGDEF)-like protein/PAS domain S-box-containing protein